MVFNRMNAESSASPSPEPDMLGAYEAAWMNGCAYAMTVTRLNPILQEFPADTRTDAQKYALEIYYKYMILRHPKIQIAGHNQFSKKVCPGFNVPEFCKSIGISDKNIYYAPK
jgi:hypothetical protein